MATNNVTDSKVSMNQGDIPGSNHANGTKIRLKPIKPRGPGNSWSDVDRDGGGHSGVGGGGVGGGGGGGGGAGGHTRSYSGDSRADARIDGGGGGISGSVRTKGRAIAPNDGQRLVMDNVRFLTTITEIKVALRTSPTCIGKQVVPAPFAGIASPTGDVVMTTIEGMGVDGGRYQLNFS